MKKTIILSLLLCLIAAGVWAIPPFPPSSSTSEVGTVTNGKWCVGDGSGLVQCTEDAPAGAGDVTSVGDDCAAGACTAFTIGGIKLGDTSPDSDGEFGFASNKYILYGGALVPATDNAYALGDSTGSQRWSDIFLGEEAVINFYGGDVTLTHSANTLTLGGGNLALGANNLTGTGSLGATGAGKLLKIWAIDLETTNAPSVNGTAANATGGLMTNPMTTAGDLITGGASGASTGRIAAAAVGQVLASAGAGIAPAYTATPLVTSIDIGNADTSIARSGAGAITVESKQVVLETVASGGIVLGDTTPDADGEIGYASNVYLWFANSEDMKATASANMWTWDSNTSAAFTFTPAVTITGLLTPNGGITLGEGKLIDLSAITMSAGVDEGFALPAYADVAPLTEKNYMSYDAANNALMVRESGGWVNVGASAAAPTTAHYVVTAASGNLSEESVITEGLAIDLTDAGGDGGAVTVAFDPTELTGNRTWAAGGSASIAWTIDLSGTDDVITFGSDLITLSNSLTVATGKNITLGTTQWNSADEIDGTKIKDADYGDINVSAGGAWTVENGAVGIAKLASADFGNFTCNGSACTIDSGAVSLDTIADGSSYQRVAAADVDASGHVNLVQDSDGTGAIQITGPTATRTITVDDAAQTLATRNRDNTFTENNTFGNADTDTFTLRSLLVGGNSRAVWIAGSAPTPTYATGTNELYVAGDIETAGTIYAAAANFGTGTDGSRSVTLSSNSALTPSGNQIYFIGDVLYFSQGGSSPAQKTPARLEDAQTFTGKKTFQGDIAVGDASNAGSIDMYDGSSNYLQLQVPSLSAEYTMIFPTGAGTTGQYLKTTTSGTTSTLSWDTPSASADTTGGTGGVQFNAAGVLTSDAGFVFTTATDKLALGSSGGSTTGTLDLYYTGTTYAATITPNASMSADVTITLPDNTSTLIGSGANTFTGSQIFSNASNNSTVAVATLTGVPALNGSDVHRGIYFAPTGSVLGTITSTGNTVAFIDLAAITGDAETNLYGMRLGNLTGTTGSAGEVEYGISIGTGWDRGISTASPVYIGDGTNGTTISTTGGQSFAGSATFTAASATSSVPWVVGSGTAANTAEGTAYWETDTDILTIGDGATGIGLDFTANTIITFPSATSTLAILGANTFTAKQTIDATTGIQVGSTGVLITSDNDGAITLLGASGGYDEDLTINLDDTENTAVVSSSTGVTKLDFSALNLATTGTIQAGITISSDADGMSASEMTTAGMYGTMFIATGAGTWILPRAALGMSACLMDSGTAHDLILDVTAGSTIRLKGTEQADGVGITNAAGTSTGDFVCVVAVATDKWSTVGIGGSWVSQ